MTSNANLSFQVQLAAGWPPEEWREVGVLVAVSGGPDSVALLRGLHAIRQEGPGFLAAAHFNHSLRGSESAADEAFVVDLARDLGVPCRRGEAQRMELAAPGDGIEAAARKARYRFLERTAAELGARYVVTGHTADDQAETILHRILRGTGIAGLAGMARTRPLGPAATLLRPLLSIRRQDVLAYLQALGQPFRCDSSNDDTRLTRNRIRRDLLPGLAAGYNRGVVEAILRLGRLADEAQSVIDGIVDDLVDRAVRWDSVGAVHVALAALAGQTPYMVRELLMAVWRRRHWPLQAMGLDQWDRLAVMALAPETTPRKQTFPGGILVEVGSEELRIEPPRR